MFDIPHQPLPPLAGIGYKGQHFQPIMDSLAAPSRAVTWLEIHAENYMGAGGRPIAQLRALAAHFPISVHGVGLSIGGERPLDRDHLARIAALCAWLNPASFSEHLAWSSHETGFLNDLLPLPYDMTTLTRVCAHIDEVQDRIGRRMLLENPSTYVAYRDSIMGEVECLTEIATRTGCGLLLDVNNVFVSAVNHRFDPRAYLADFPLSAVGEIHLAGHDSEELPSRRASIDRQPWPCGGRSRLASLRPATNCEGAARGDPDRMGQ